MSKSTIITPVGPLRAGDNERGMALLLTLLVTIILSIVVLEFNYLMRVHATLSNNLIGDLQAETAAFAGIETAKAILLNDLLEDSENTFASDTYEEEWASEITFESESSETEVLISDETAKLNLNRLINRPLTESDLETENISMVENVNRLLESLEIEPDLVDNMLDWLDENDEAKLYGAESSYYESLNPPIRCKNGPLDSVDELLFIKDIDANILYGNESGPGLAEFVTVCGDKHALTNINTAPEEVIAAILNSESLASTIEDMRQSAPFESSEDMATRLPDIKLTDKFITSSSFFLVSSTGRTLSGGVPTREVRIRALLKRVHSEDAESDYFSIDTMSWKVDR